MLWEYNKRDLNLFEYILYNAISAVIYWVMYSFIFSIQGYILEKLSSTPGLDLLISLCPVFVLFWFMEVNTKKFNINSLGDYSGIVALIIFTVTQIILLFFFGLLKISL